ncbi:uncharacterized protein FIBRA_02980 [Fibroporia radiculosa]|uniref:Uncharacterized protein n=1 Tax=Fibroporia radiculosa TaxID=599839 RepID=J4G3P8_9APHY|nr:uncharacterized protein FIBRA_02980 [Fibroporia radiculosa]CCM00933.1 predicted protein [Fibroporia radiculosa]
MFLTHPSRSKSFSFLLPFWPRPPPPPPPTPLPTVAKAPPAAHILLNSQAPPLSSSPVSPSDPAPHSHSANMKLGRKARKPSRIGISNTSRLSEDPHTLMAAPSPFLSPSPSPSATSFADSQHSSHSLSGKISLKRSLTAGGSAVVSTIATAVERARPPTSLSRRPSTSPATSASPSSPIRFAHPDQDSPTLSDADRGVDGDYISTAELTLCHPNTPEADDRPPAIETPVSSTFGRTSGPEKLQLDHSPEFSSTLINIDKQLQHIFDDDCRAPSSPADASHVTSPPSSAPSPRPLPSPPPPFPLVKLSSPNPSSSSLLSPSTISRLMPTVVSKDSLERPLPQRSASLRNKSPATFTKRRLSLDIRTLSAESGKGARLRKGRSILLARKVSAGTFDGDDQGADARDADRLGLGAPMSDKQRALNVKRAKKMMQLFGDEPPKELFQATTPLTGEDAFDTISILTTVSENRRDSRATFASVTSSTISLTVHRRTEVAQGEQKNLEQAVLLQEEALQSTDDLPTHKVESSSNTEDPGLYAESDSESDTELPPLHLAPSVLGHAGFHQPRLKPSIQSMASMATYHSRTQSTHSQVPLTPRTPPQISEPLPSVPLPPRTPPPFSSYMTPTPENAPAEPAHEHERAQSPPPEEFRARRMRAAKLSRFFGVAPNDLAGVLVGPHAPSSPASLHGSNGMHGMTSSQDLASTEFLPSSTASDRLNAKESGHGRNASTTVEVAAEVPRVFRLGRLERKPVQDLDMADVLDQLRRMR